MYIVTHRFTMDMAATISSGGAIPRFRSRRRRVFKWVLLCWGSGSRPRKFGSRVYAAQPINDGCGHDLKRWISSRQVPDSVWQFLPSLNKRVTETSRIQQSSWQLAKTPPQSYANKTMSAVFLRFYPLNLRPCNLSQYDEYNTNGRSEVDRT